MLAKPPYRLLTEALLLAALGGGGIATASPRPLAPEPIPAVRQLPSTLPRDWVMIHDVNAGGVSDGRIVVIDLKVPEVRAQIGAAFLANFRYAPARRELYVAETFYSRGHRGSRTDVVSIYDTQTMAHIGEIALPPGKRGIFVPHADAFQLIHDDKWGLVFNFTPAASVSVVDLVGRKVLSEIEIPGCSLIYPLGGRNFGTLCGDGTLLSISLDEQGKLASSQSSAAFNNIDDDPMFMRPAMAGRTAWFATFRGKLQPIDLSGPVARAGAAFAIPMQPGGAPEWRPGGVQIVAADAAGRLYVLMNPNGDEGTHKDGGTEVWLIDPQTQALIRRIPLAIRALSIAVTQEAQPSLTVIGIDRALRVYNPETGTLTATLPVAGLTPFTLETLP